MPPCMSCFKNIVKYCLSSQVLYQDDGHVRSFLLGGPRGLDRHSPSPEPRRLLPPAAKTLTKLRFQSDQVHWQLHQDQNECHCLVVSWNQ